MSRITMSLENDFEGRVLASFDLDEFANKVRADAIDEFANKLIDELHYNVSAKPVTIHTPYATPIMIDGEIQKVAEQLKEQK